MKKFLLFLWISLFSLILVSSKVSAVEKLLLPVPLDEILEPIVVTCGENQNYLPPKFRRVARYEISAVNPTMATNPAGALFPGYRGSDQLVIYKPGYGKYTGTNEYGKEAIVVNGRIIDFNGANSRIPLNGYVISGHGKAKTWMNRNLIEGAYVKICPDSNLIESVVTPQSYIYKAGHRIEEVEKVILDYKKSIPDYQYSSAQKYYDAARERLNKAKYSFSAEKYDKALKNLRSALLLSEEAFYYSVPGVRNEFHGIWLRPVEKNKSEIVKTLKELKKTGIDNIFLETYYQGYTIFPSKTMQKYGITSQKPEFTGWDPLKIWIKEAHKRGMKIHVWFQAFYAGNEDVSQTPGHILYIYPEWANIQRKNAYEDVLKPFVSEHNGYFLDPANHIVRKFLLSLINEISSDYDIDGLNIDYVRYPQSLSPNFSGYLASTWGYTKEARNNFRKKYRKDPLDLDVQNPLWQKWIRYRQNYVTEFVSKVKSAVNNKNIVISTVIFSDTNKTAVTKLQNWLKWIQNNYVDAVTPLIMSSDEYRAEISVRKIKKIVGNKAKIYPGLFEPFTSGNPISLLYEIMAVRKAGASGIVIFDKAHLNKDFEKALKVRVLRN